MTPQELLQTACPAIGTVGAGFYFAPETLAVGKELGLDGMRWYMLGRGGVLGDVESPVVASAFGYFNPSMVEKLWGTAKAKLAPRDAGHRYFECAANIGRAKFADIDGLGAFNEAAQVVIAAAHPAALAMFAGIAAEPLTDDTPGRAMQLAAVLRELRGSAHLVAILASGLSPEKAHFIRRPEMYKAFGYDDANPPTVTADDKARLDASDALTDQLLLATFSVVDAEGADALAAGAVAMKEAIG